jgi:signal transduction histidine kinase
MTVPSSAVAALVNLVGFLAAAALYAMLLVMVWRGRGSRGHKQSFDRLALAAALLGLVWNVGELLMQSLREWGGLDLGPLVSVAAFTALGFLPALTVHTVLRSSQMRGRGAALASGTAYGLGAFAGLAHIAAGAVTGDAPSPMALRVLAVGFLALVPVVVAMAPTATNFRASAVSAIALVAFGISALHLSVHRAADETLSAALYGHHASLPLVIAILFQDYRFALADVFLKRALSLVALAGLALGLYLGAVIPVMAASGGTLGSGAVIAIVSVWVGMALLYPLLRRYVDRLVDLVILDRPDYAATHHTLVAEMAAAESIEGVLDCASRALSAALRAPVTWRARPGNAASAEPAQSRSRPGHGDSVTLDTAEAPRYVLEIGAAPDGRRLLSDELDLLEAAALVTARRIDAVRLSEERRQRDRREMEMARLAAESELRALRAQLHPHFLFNALTTIGYLLRAAPERALETLLQLTTLLRAVLKRTKGGDLTTLGQEIDLVKAYLAIERARFEERLRVRIELPTALRSAAVPPLLLQPLVENAIKHGIGPRRDGGEIRVFAANRGGRLRLSVSDSGQGATEADLRAGREKGLGLANIERRLAMHYGEGARLTVESSPGHGTTVVLDLPPPETAATTAFVVAGGVRS